MKKLFYPLIWALIATIAMPAAAQLVESPELLLPQSRRTIVKAPALTASEESVVKEMIMGCNEGYAGGVGAGRACTIEGAIEVPVKKAEMFKGNSVTRVRVGVGTPVIGANRTIVIFLTKELGGEPFYTKSHKFMTGGRYLSFTLDTPYEITGEKFYIGYAIESDAKDSPIGVDGYTPSDEYPSHLAIDGEWGYAYQWGLNYNLCIEAVVEGENLPKYDATIDYAVYESFVKTGESFTIESSFTNVGAAAIKTLEVKYEMGTQEPIVKSYDYTGVAYGKTGTFTLETSVAEEALGLPLKVTITKVNGNDDLDMTYNTYESVLHIVDGRYDRNVVVEEGTGTWCGYCPRGMVGMEYMKETYYDTFIPIAVHVGDEMQVNDYVMYYPASGYPTSNINRYYYGVDPNIDYLEQCYNDERKRQAIGQIDITDVKIADNKATITTTTKFACGSNNAQFNIAYVLTEDGVGPYLQANYFSGGSPMGGWEKLGQTVETKFNDVARHIDGYYGVPGTVPTTVVKDQANTYTYTMDIRNVTDVNNMTIAVLLLDNNVGDIVNAAKWKYGSAGVNDIEIDGASVAVTAAEGAINIAGEFETAYVFTIDGKLVASTTEASIATAPGLYIVKVVAGAESIVEKVIVK